MFVYQITLPPAAAEAFVKTYALTPSHIQLALEGHRYTPLEAFLPLFTCMFLHGGFLISSATCGFFGFSAAMSKTSSGHFGYLLFYIVCGLGLRRYAGALFLGIPSAFAGSKRRNFGSPWRLYSVFPAFARF